MSLKYEPASEPLTSLRDARPGGALHGNATIFAHICTIFAHICTIFAHMCTIFAHICTIFAHICTIFAHICTIFAHICTIFAHICTIFAGGALHGNAQPRQQRVPALPAHPPPLLPPRHRPARSEILLVRIHFVIVMIRWTGLAPWEYEFPFPGSLTSTLSPHPPPLLPPRHRPAR